MSSDITLHHLFSVQPISQIVTLKKPLDEKPFP